MIIAIVQKKEHVGVGVSFPKNIIKKIDSTRGDVSRSRYLLRILEEHENVKNNMNLLMNRKSSQDLLDSRLESQQPSKSSSP